ncbi:MAG TPA: PPOX class F420-dependent oxidoreductase [Acidimicrobiales bacterium]|nr:PPOX class F420-dependent oxidoreductase [Acidimicrobiales bacterium]
MADDRTEVDIPETHRDLLDAQVGILGTIDHKDRPQLSPVWFLAAGGTVRLSLNTSRRKVENLQRNSAVSFLILDLANPYRYLELRGYAEILEDVDYLFADKVGAKYGGADLRQNDRPGEYRVVVTIHPTTVHAVNLAG